MLSAAIHTLYKKYSAGIHNLPPINIRDLLEFKKLRKPINIKEVEPIEEILKDLEAEACLMEHYQQRLMKLWQWG